jgi:hypothetical protein
MEGQARQAAYEIGKMLKVTLRFPIFYPLVTGPEGFRRDRIADLNQCASAALSKAQRKGVLRFVCRRKKAVAQGLFSEIYKGGDGFFTAQMTSFHDAISEE